MTQTRPHGDGTHATVPPLFVNFEDKIDHAKGVIFNFRETRRGLLRIFKVYLNAPGGFFCSSKILKTLTVVEQRHDLNFYSPTVCIKKFENTGKNTLVQFRSRILRAHKQKYTFIPLR